MIQGMSPPHEGGDVMFTEGKLGLMMDEIMLKIQEHLKEDKSNFPIHFNRTYEEILCTLKKYIDFSNI